MAVPNDLATVDAVAAEGYFVKVAQGDQRAASLFARLVAYRLNPNGDQSGWGWLTKSGAEAQVDGYAEDSIVYGSNPNDLNNVVDIVAGTGAPGATTRWGPVPRRASNRWEAPRPLSETDLAYLRGGAAPGPTPTPGAGWEPKHSDLLARFPASSTPNRDTVRRIAEQFAFSFPGEGWGHKAKDASSPPSDDVMARQTSSAFTGYRIIPRTANPQTFNLTGQRFISVTPTNHLGVPSPGPTPTPTPPPVPTPQPAPIHDAAFYTRLVAPILANYAGRGEPVNSGIGEWIWRTVQRVDHEGMTLEQSIAKTVSEMPPA